MLTTASGMGKNDTALGEVLHIDMVDADGGTTNKFDAFIVV